MPLDNDDIKQLIAILQKGLSNDTDDVDDEPIRKPARKPSNKTPKKNTKKKMVNRFENMPEFSMCKDDLEIDRKIRKPPPSGRKPPVKFISVQCRVCGKKESVAPALVESIERYKCNKCSTGAG